MRVPFLGLQAPAPPELDDRSTRDSADECGWRRARIAPRVETLELYVCTSINGGSVAWPAWELELKLLPLSWV